MRVTNIVAMKGTDGGPSYWQVTITHGHNSYTFHVAPTQKGYVYVWNGMIVDEDFNVSCSDVPFTQLVLLHSMIPVFRAYAAFKQLPELPEADGE